MRRVEVRCHCTAAASAAIAAIAVAAAMLAAVAAVPYRGTGACRQVDRMAHELSREREAPELMWRQRRLPRALPLPLSRGPLRRDVLHNHRSHLACLRQPRRRIVVACDLRRHRSVDALVHEHRRHAATATAIAAARMHPRWRLPPCRRCRHLQPGCRLLAAPQKTTQPLRRRATHHLAQRQRQRRAFDQKAQQHVSRVVVCKANARVGESHQPHLPVGVDQCVGRREAAVPVCGEGTPRRHARLRPSRRHVDQPTGRRRRGLRRWRWHR